MNYWANNIKALSRKNKRLADELERLDLQEKNGYVRAKELQNGAKILEIEESGHIWHLNSRLDPEGAAELYAQRYSVKPFYRYFIFGFSDGRAIRKLLEKCDDSNIVIICEPDKEIMAEALRQFDLEALLTDERVWPCLSEMWDDMCCAVFGTVDYSYINLVEFCILPGYDVLYTESCQKFIDEVIDRIRNEVVNRHTHMYFERAIPRNILYNMRNMIRQRNAIQMKSVLEQEKIEDVPAIIVGAGPSLDKNIKEMKRAVGKAFIFVVDAALNTVMREGIRPDLACTVDPKAPERFYERAERHELLWSSSCWANPNMLKKYGKKVFYHNSVNPWWSKAVQEELGYSIFPKMETGGCVSAEAFQLARYLGFQTIIFVGQDLAFTNGHTHTNGIKGVLGTDEDYISHRYIVQVEDADGNLLDTDFQMNFYRQWFEKKIRQNKGKLRVIDATEGGAKIEGAIIQSLKDTIDQECKREINAFDRMKEIPPLFDETQQQHLYEKMKEIKELKCEFEKETARCITLEQELADHAEEMDTKEMLEKLKEIAQQNEKMNSHPFIHWITMYASKEEADLQDNILVQEDMSVKEMMERSIRLLKTYQTGISLFEEDLEEALRE